MIDKIDGNGVYYPDQKKRKNPAVRAYENTPGTKEAAQKKAAGTQKKRKAGAADSSESGVILDLSVKKARGREQARGQKKETSWTDALRKLFAPVLQWMKAFWESDSPKAQAETPGAADQTAAIQGTDGRESDAEGQTMDVQGMEAEILEGGVQGMEAGTLGGGLQGLDMEETVLPPLDALEEMDLEAVRDAAVKSGSIEKIEQFVTHNGTKHLARNSDLLTYYDRRGKIVELDETEKHRVLFGDKNVLKL